MRSNAISEGRNRMLTEPGLLYAAYSRGECWVKVGFTLNVERRLSKLNSHFKPLAPFKLIGSTPSLYQAERQIHRILSPFRCRAVGLSRELYLAVPEVERVAHAVVAGAGMQPLSLEEVRRAHLWSIDKVYSQDMRDGIRALYEMASKAGYVEVIE